MAKSPETVVFISREPSQDLRDAIASMARSILLFHDVKMTGLREKAQLGSLQQEIWNGILGMPERYRYLTLLNRPPNLMKIQEDQYTNELINHLSSTTQSYGILEIPSSLLVVAYSCHSHRFDPAWLSHLTFRDGLDIHASTIIMPRTTSL